MSDFAPPPSIWSVRRRKTANTSVRGKQAGPVSSKATTSLAEANVILHAEKVRLEEVNTSLEAANNSLEQKVRSLQVCATILLACCGGLGAGLAARIAGATAQTSFTSATGVFFALIMASIAILNFMRR